MTPFDITVILIYSIATASSLFCLGLFSNKIKNEKDKEIILVCSIIWPFLLGLLLIAAPFVFCYSLGALIHKIVINKKGEK